MKKHVKKVIAIGLITILMFIAIIVSAPEITKGILNSIKI